MTINLYSCLQPDYNESEHWGSSTTLSISAIEELMFWKLNIVKLNSFAISPTTPSIKTFELVAGDASGEAL